MRIIKSLRSRLTMVKQYTLFIDRVNRKAVFEYKDCFGEKWMARSKFGFRTKMN